VRLERVVRNDAKLSIVTSQPHIKGRAATPPEIDATMKSKGFEKLAPGAYYHAGERILVHDMHPRNAVFSEGVAVPIDPAIQHATPEFAAFLKANPHLLDPR
jgi:Serine/Threonine/Tyrosine Kinase found in polyvalent proteins